MREAITMHFRNIVARAQRLKQSSTSFSSFETSSLGSTSLPPCSTIIDSKLSSLSSELWLLKSSVCDLLSRIGQDAIEVGGVHSQSLSQTFAWFRSHLPSNAYFVFQDVMTLLNLIGASNLTDNKFLDGYYKVNRANFVNDSTTQYAASFRRELTFVIIRRSVSFNQSFTLH